MFFETKIVQELKESGLHFCERNLYCRQDLILSEGKANLVCYCYDFSKNLIFRAENNHILVNNTGFDVVVISFLEYNEAISAFTMKSQLYTSLQKYSRHKIYWWWINKSQKFNSTKNYLLDMLYTKFISLR